MVDPRIKKLANTLLQYSVDLQKKEKILIAGSYLGMPLMKELYRGAILTGAYPEIHIFIQDCEEILLKEGSNDQIKYISERDKVAIEKYDVVLSLSGNYNTKNLARIDPEKIATRKAARKNLITTFYSRANRGELRWCTVNFPTHASAQDAEMSLEDYETFVFKTMALNRENPAKYWQRIFEKQRRICNFLNTRRSIRFLSKDTDLSMNIEGRKWINCDGKINFPDGEVYTTPHKTSVEGHIRFSFPRIYNGQNLEDVTLSFKAGKVCEAKAKRNLALLERLLDTDEGSRYVGEIGIGTNFEIETFTRNMVFDEKIGGTIHLGMGAVIGNTGGENESGLHLDMLCDMREIGIIYADNEIIYEKGHFLMER